MDTYEIQGTRSGITKNLNEQLQLHTFNTLSSIVSYKTNETN